MPQLLRNNVSGVLSTQLTAGSTSMQLVSAAAFPDPGADYYLCTLIGLNGNAQENSWEIVKVTAKASNTLTIVRAQEGTSDVTWPSATTVQMRLTAASVATPDDLSAHVADTTAAHAASAISNTPSGNIAATTVQAAINELDSEKEPVITTLSVAKGGTGQTTAVAAFDALAPTTTLGDLIFHNGTDNVRLAGTVTTSKRFLTQTGTGTVSAAPGWNTIVDGDVPSALTGKTYNGLTLTAAATGFTVAGGTTSKTLTVSNTLTLAGTDSSTLNVGAGGTLGSAAFTASTAYEPAITTLAVSKGGTGAGTFTANNVLLGNGTSAFQVVAPGTSGNVLTSNGTTWVSQASADASLSGNNAFTGANTFYNATGQTFGTATATQDGIILAGRAGGTTSLRVTLSPGTLTASRSVTFPDAAGAVVLDTAAQTLTNKTLTSPIISSISNTGTLTLPNITDTLVGRATSDTLTNKTISGGTLIGSSNFTAGGTTTQDGVIVTGRAGGTGTLRVTILPTTLTANRTLTLPDADGTVLTTAAAVTVAQGGTGLTSGTSGGIPYFSSTSALTSSALLAANAIVIGGGAGAAPATTTTGTGVLTAIGNAVNATGGLVTVDGTSTLINKTLSTATISGNTTGSDGLMTRMMFQDCGWDYHDSGTTNALNFTNGSHQRWAPNTGAQTLSITNWPPSTNLGELLIEGVNLGAATITWPTINWVNPDGTTTTTASTYFSNAGRALKTSGTDFIFLWTRDAGTTIYGKLI